MLQEIRDLIRNGLVELAISKALILAESKVPAEMRAVACLLAAECAATLADADEAERLLRRATQVGPDGSESLQRSMLRLGKVYLHRNEITLAEQVFLEALARNPRESALNHLALYGLGEVYAAQRRWNIAAQMYGQAAVGFAKDGTSAQAFALRNNQIWALLMAGELDAASEVLAVCASSLEQADEHSCHVHQALVAYYLYRTNSQDAWDRTADLITAGGPSTWANCLAAVTGGWLAHRVGMVIQAREALLLAEHTMFQASGETNSTDIINLVNELRVCAV